MAVENYHLKWDSHVSYLNSSVATLYKNEKFADVVLYSSSSSSCNNGNNSIDNAIPTVGISAHKFILSSCSQFFATLFDNTPISTSNGVLYVVLPPELSHRAIQILVQYIYTGEATVSNDILNEVLRGGEILKIRGLCRTATQRESSNTGITNSSSSGTCGNSIHYGTNGTRHMLPPVIHGTTQLPSAALTTDLYVSSKCNAQNMNGGGGGSSSDGSCTGRYRMEQLTHSQSSIHSQIRGLGASVMPKDSPVIVKSPKLSQMGPHGRAENSKQHHGSGITINKEVAIDPDENCCYQANVVPTILQHEQLQLPLPPSQSLVSIGGGGVGGGGSVGLCNDISCKNCSFTNATTTTAESEKHRQRQRNLSQSEELPHRLPGIDRLDREYSDERCDPPDVQLSYNRRNRSGNERVSNYFVTDHYDPASHAQAHLIAAVKTPKQYSESSNVVTPSNTGVVNNNLHSPTLYPHNFLTIKQEPVDWTTPQTSSIDNADDMIDRQSLQTSPQPHGASSPKQPLDFKIPMGSSSIPTVKIEASTLSHSADEDDMATGSSMSSSYNNFSRLICDICKKSFDEPKLWVQHLETHTTATTTSTTVAATMAASNNSASINENSGTDTLNKSYVPKKRRRVSQQENNMVDHVTLLCDLCNTSFDTPAEWVRHMNSQHTEIELAMFNSKKDKEQKSTNTSAISCSSSTRSHHQHQHHTAQHQHQHQQQQHHHHPNQHHHQKHHHIQKKYVNRVGMSLTHSRGNDATLPQTRSCTLAGENGITTKILRSSTPTTLEQQRINDSNTMTKHDRRQEWLPHECRVSRCFL